MAKTMIRTGLVLLGASLALQACNMPSMKKLNPFAEKELILPGERVAILSPADKVAVDNSVRGKVSLGGASQSGWSQPGGNAANNPGNASYSGVAQRVWRTSGSSLSGGTFSMASDKLRASAPPIIHAGRAFIYRPNGQVQAYSLSNGGRTWSVSVAPEGESARVQGGGIAASGNVLVVASGYGAVVALDVNSGKRIWTKDIGTPMRSAPTIANGRVFVTTATNVVYALSLGDGGEVWTYRGIPESAGLLANSSPAVSGSTVVVPYSSGEVIAFDTAKGTPKWSDSVVRSGRTNAVSLLSDVAARPVISGNMVFASGVSGRMIAASLRNGERLWTRNIGTAHTPIVSGNTVFVVDLRGQALALDKASGKVRWLTKLPSTDGQKWSGPALGSGKVWLVSSTGNLLALSAGTGQQLSVKNTSSPSYVSPIIANGRLFILEGSGSLAAYN